MGWLAALWRSPRRGHDESLDLLRRRGFIAIDLETTGLDPRRDRIVAAAALKFIEGESVPELVTLVNPGQRIPASATRVHGIDDAMVSGAPDETTAVARLDAITGGEVIVGHAVAFDITVLARARRAADAARPPRAVLCTQRLAAALYPAWPDCSLEALCGRLGVGLEGRHTADGDARMAGRLLLELVPRLQQRGIRTLAEALWFQDAAGPPTR